MKLNHINLVVADVAAAIHLFETCFDFTCTDIKGDNAIAVLQGSGGFTLVLMTGRDGQDIYPRAFHIGFMQESVEAVNKIYDHLKVYGAGVGRSREKSVTAMGFIFFFKTS